MVLVKNEKFFYRFVLCKINPEKVFGDVLVRKQAFLDNINMDWNKRKIDIFAKRIGDDFGQKVKVFSSFVFIKNRSRKSVCLRSR